MPDDYHRRKRHGAALERRVYKAFNERGYEPHDSDEMLHSNFAEAVRHHRNEDGDSSPLRWLPDIAIHERNRRRRRLVLIDAKQPTAQTGNIAIALCALAAYRKIQDVLYLPVEIVTEYQDALWVLTLAAIDEYGFQQKGSARAGSGQALVLVPINDMIARRRTAYAFNARFPHLL